MSLTCFKAYDICGKLGTDLDEAITTRIGWGFARAFGAKKVVLGRDIRASSESLAGADGGICANASHNPVDYNGMKMVRVGSAPLDAATGLASIKSLAEADDFGPVQFGSAIRDVATEARAAYVQSVLSFIDVSALKSLKIVVNSGYGAAGPTFDAIAATLEAEGSPLTDLAAERRAAFPSPGEFNFHLADPKAAIARAAYGQQAKGVDETDGMGLDMGDWRFNLRSSNAEPVVRLNLESRRAPSSGLLDEITALMCHLLVTLNGHSGIPVYVRSYRDTFQRQESRPPYLSDIPRRFGSAPCGNISIARMHIRDYPILGEGPQQARPASQTAHVAVVGIIGELD